MATVLITGANRGIGYVLAEAFVARGDDVIATARNTADARLSALTERSGRMRVLPMALDDFASIDRLGATLEGQPIDIFISNAALTGGELGTFGQTDYERFEACLVANAMAPMRLAERLAESVAASERRIMFFIGSRLGAHPFLGYAGYMVSKTALTQVVMQVSLALKTRGVIAVAAHPGWVATDATASHGQAPLTPAQSAAMLMGIIDKLTMADSGRFFDPDGSELPLVTRQLEEKPYGKAKGATR